MQIEDLRNKDVILYGGAYIGKLIAVLLKKIGISISEVTESNTELWNTEFIDGLLIKSNIDVLCGLRTPRKDYIIITAFTNDALFRQSLVKNGFVSISWKKVIDLFVDTYNEETYDIDYNGKFREWFMGVASELDFWETVYARPNARKHALYLQLADTENFYEKYLTREVKENDIIMDVGAGILSRYGNVLNSDKKIILLPIDPLACWYNFFNEKYLDTYRFFRKEKILFGLFEKLSNMYPTESADVIIISNALDHCVDPFRSILESLKVLKIGGTLLLKHLRREAINEKEIGFHQWNMDVSKEEFIIWNKENYINVSNVLRHYIDITISVYKEDERGYSGNFRFLVIEIIKRKEIDCDLLEKYEKKALPLFLEQLENIFSEIVGEQYKNQDIWVNKFQTLSKEKDNIV